MLPAPAMLPYRDDGLGMHINFTQAAGLLALVPAASAAALLSQMTPRSRLRERFAWAMIAIVHALLAVELVVMNRFRIDQSISGWIKTAGIYSERRPIQAAVVLITTVLAIVALIVMRQVALTRHLLISASATTILIGIFLVESVSLHAIDAMFYQLVGPIMLIAWLWLVWGAVTTAAAGHAIFCQRNRNFNIPK